MSIRKKIWLTLLGIVGLAFFASAADFKELGIPYLKDLDVKFGLDLRGGTHLVYQADVSKIESQSIDDSLSGVRDVIERRVNALGVSEPLIQTDKTEGNYRVIVELAGVTDVNEAINMIGQTPTLDFREMGEPIDVSQIKDEQGNPIEIDPSQIPPNFVPTDLSGSHLKRSSLQFDPNTNKPLVSLEFNDDGAKLFGEITKRNVGKPLAIYLDGEQISAPTVQAEITAGEAVIEGDFDIDYARTLAQRLNAGALPVPVTLLSQQTIGASLGAESIAKSLQAALIGLVAVSLFMIIYYRLPGILAVLALMIYGLILLALVKIIPITMTLSGIAGFVLSIGMAVDANILIFERLKEELKQGKDMGLAVEEGFKHAWKSIRDSNVSTLITCFILGTLSTSIVKGFAITLGIGVLISLFSAITVTRTFLRLLIGTKIAKVRFLFSRGIPKQES
ncbi:MAG: hypothetical protein ACD_68C00119G0002 [uncultured bacterium]|nr:MAG: hypothetical protein ACD_68C00119G0002 [uncultured bacterium]